MKSPSSTIQQADSVKFPSAQEMVQAWLKRPDFESFVSQVDPQAFYFVVQELGLSDSMELLKYGSVEQIQACFDLVGWKRDQPDPEQLIPWIQALLELGPEKVGPVFDFLDHEWVVGFLHRYMRAYDLINEQVPEESEGQFYSTPDRMFVVDVLSDAHGPMFDRLLESLYMHDLTLARRILLGIMWDQGPETEEMAYRFHMARLADLGYPDPHEALEIYQTLDPKKIHIGEGTGPIFDETWLSLQNNPVFLPSDWVDGKALASLLLAKAWSHFSDHDQRVVLQHVVYLLNRALSAEGISVHDAETVRPVVQRTLGYLSLGLEAVVQNAYPPQEGFALAVNAHSAMAIDLAAQALRTVAVKRLFQGGYTLVVQTVKLAWLLFDAGCVAVFHGKTRHFLVDDGHAALFEGLLREDNRPLYAAWLDDPTQPGHRPFSGLRDIQRTVEALGQVGSQVRFLTLGLGVRSDVLQMVVQNTSMPMEGIHFSNIVATLIGNFLLQRPPALVLLNKTDAVQLQIMAKKNSKADPSHVAWTDVVVSMIKQRIQERALDPEEEKEFLAHLSAPLMQDALHQLRLFFDALAAHRTFKEIPPSLLKQAPILFSK